MEHQEKPERKLGLFKRFLGIFGIRYPREPGQWMLLTRRFRRLVAVFVLAVLALACWFVFYYSKTPEFCASCHHMEPYVQSWRESKHGEEGVFCNDCHFPPGVKNYLRAKAATMVELIKHITKTQGPSPQAEVEDASCLRGGCHDISKLDDKKVFFKDKYPFDHGRHLSGLRRGKELRCTSCHSQIVQGEHLTVTENVCFTCHFKNLVHGRKEDPVAGCTSCHEPPSEPIKLSGGTSFDHKPYLDRDVDCWKCHFDTVQGTGEVAKQVCRTCHDEVEKLEKYSDSQFMHDWHVTKRKVECFQCHSEIRHGLHPEPYQQEASCELCHSAGHSAHEDMYAGRGGKGVQAQPSQMHQTNVDCLACHQAPSFEGAKHPTDMASYRATEKACLDCHGSAMKGILGEWLEVLDETLSEAQAKLALAEKAYQTLPQEHPRKAKAKELLEVARHNCEFVAKARGVHHLEYAMDLLDKASQNSTEVIRIAGEANSPPALQDD